MVLGIDLGTTHCALAHAQPDRPVDLFPVAQVLNPGEIVEQPLLPSFLYAPLPNEDCALPWDEKPSMVAGVFAQRRGGETLGRMVASAKSWLSHAGVDRTAALLPLNAPDGVAKISPVDASSRYLAHLREAWNYGRPENEFHRQSIVVGVPASFDSVARELTLDAAKKAGYPDVVLLEEPQAAFYAWIERHEDWRERVRVGDVILVIDIGGGTTDFTLIAVTEAAGELKLDRIAVGDHILLGGDNMDLALARHVADGLAAKGTKLDALQFQALWQQCRTAKEKLLDPSFEADDYPVTILGRGTGLVGGTIRAKLTRAEVQSLLVDGFLPRVERDARPAKARRAGLAEIGLPYAADAAITRHLAEFLARAGDVQPTRVLFNGGVLRGQAIRERVLEVLNSWLPHPAEPLEGDDLMHAVARGAAYYGLARSGRGVRIRGGISKTYYAGIETSAPAVPGMPAPMKALAVAPFGMEEGTSHRFPDQQFGLYVGEPAEFRFFSSSRHDRPGAILEEIPEDLVEMPPMEVTLTGEAGVTPVTLESHVSETGMLELYCVASDGRRWKLAFNVREKVSR
jgi:molecular chaperone DnaK (HSP70)